MSTSLNLAEKKIYDFLGSHGHPLDKPINHDSSKFHSFKCPHGSSTDARYKFFSDGIVSGYFKCWKCQKEANFCSKQKHEVSPEEWQDHVKRMAECKRQNEFETQQRHVQAAKSAKNTWTLATEENASEHGYLRLKHVKNYGLRILTHDITYQVFPTEYDETGKEKIFKVYKGTLLVPCYNANDELVNLERVYFDKKENKFQKRPLKGGQRISAYYMLGEVDPKGVIFIAEGYSSGATAHEATGHPTAITFNCGNVYHIAKILRQKYPQTLLVIIADDDKWNDDPKLRHAGLKAAKKACAAVKNTKYLLPDFSALGLSDEKLAELKPTDINDFFVLLMEKGINREAALVTIRQLILNPTVISKNEKIENKKKPHNEEKITGQSNEQEPLPLPESLPKVMPFDPEMLPESIRHYVVDVAERQQSSLDFVSVSCVCGLSSLLGRKAFMCPKQQDNWIVVPNLWAALIGRPSTMKSPAMKAALEPVKDIDFEATRQYETAKQEYEINKELSELNKSSAREKAKEHIKKGRDEEAKATLQAANFTESPPTRKRIIVNDASLEKLGELLNENSNGLLLIRDELSGWLAKLAKEEYAMDRSFYLECFEGDGSYVYDRIGRGTVDIKSTTLSIVGGIQPTKIRPLIRDAIKGTIDDGLIQRLQLSVWPNDVGHWEWNDRAPNKKAQDSYFKAYKSLHDLNFNTENGEPPYFRFTDAAQHLFIQWMNEIQKTARADDTHPALESHLLKMPKTITSLALIFQILNNIEKSAPGMDLLVGEEPTAQALEWADYLKSHAERIYSIATHQGLEGARLILKRIDRLNDVFTAREIQQKDWTGLSEVRIIEEALDWLIDYKHISSQEIPSTIFGGRPTIRYLKNKKYTNGAKK